MNHRMIATGLFIAWLATSAFGAPPPPTPRAQNMWNSVHSVTINHDCSFPMEIDTFAQTLLHRQYDATGKLVKTTITTAQGRMTFTNQENRRSVWTPIAGITVRKTNPDGSLTFGWTGVKTRIVVPGGGLLSADLGRVEWTIGFDANGGIASFELSRSGIQNGFYPGMLCSILE